MHAQSHIMHSTSLSPSSLSLLSYACPSYHSTSLHSLDAVQVLPQLGELELEVIPLPLQSLGPRIRLGKLPCIAAAAAAVRGREAWPCQQR
jgi:hypothetical protein